MKLARSVLLLWVPFALSSGACGGTSTSSAACSLDPACYVVEPGGECSLDTNAICVDGAWQCSARGTLGSGCLPDGGIAPPHAEDAGAPDSGAGVDACSGLACQVCSLPSFDVPCNGPDDAACAQYGSAFCYGGLCTCPGGAAGTRQ